MIRRSDTKWICAVCLLAIAYASFFMLLFARGYTSEISTQWQHLAEYDQIAWKVAHAHGGAPTILAERLFQIPERALRKSHFCPVMWGIACLYRIGANINVLYGVNVLCIAFGVIPIFLIARHKGLGNGVSFLLCMTYVLYPVVHYMTLVDFRPIQLSLFFLLWMFYFFYTERYVFFLCAAVCAMSCYEPVALNVCLFGVYAWTQKRSVKWTAIPIVAGCVWFLGVVMFVLPLFGFREFVLREYFGDFDDVSLGVVSVFPWACAHVQDLCARLCAPERWAYLLQLLYVPLFPLPYFSPMVILVGLPSILLNFLQVDSFPLDEIHMVVPLVPCLMVAAIMTVVKVQHIVAQRYRKIVLPGIVLVIPLLFVWKAFCMTEYIVLDARTPAGSVTQNTGGTTGLRRMYFVKDDTRAVGEELDALIPRGHSLFVSHYFAAWVSHRREVYCIEESRKVYAQQYEAAKVRSIDTIIIAKPQLEQRLFDLKEDIETMRELVALLKQEPLYVLIKETNDYLLFTRAENADDFKENGAL